MTSKKKANSPATKGSDEKGTFIMSLNCIIKILLLALGTQKVEKIVIVCIYPSGMCVNWTISLHDCVLIEVLWYRQSHENRETEDEFCSEAV